MAGESPDKSDKKQSSGETARSKRDPRLSAFRGEPAEPAKESRAGTDSKPEKKPEAAAAPKPAAKSGSAAKPGSGTKSRSGVKSGSAAESKSSAEPESAVEPESAAELESAAESESAGSSVASAGADAPEASEASEGAAEGADGGKRGTGGKGGGDDRLRAVVAAWVAGADDGDAEGAQDAEGGDGGDADEASAGSGDLGEGADGDGDGGTGEGADGAVAKPSVEPEAAAEPKADEEADGKGKAAAKGAGVAGSEPKAESGAEPKAEAESKTATKVVDQPTAVFKTVGPQKGKPDEKGGAAADGKAEVKGKGKNDGKGDGGDEGDADVDESAVDEATRVFAVAKLKGKGAAAGAVDQATTAFKINAPAKSKDAAKDKDASESKAAAKDKAAGESGSKAEAKPGSAAAGKGKGKSGTKDGADAKTDSKADAKSDAKAEAKSDAKSDAKAGEKADAKAGDKAGSKADSKAPGTSERDSERTSQFVALKSADDGTAGKSLGKTAPRTPARTSEKAGDKTGDKAAEQPAEKSGSQAAAKAADKAADKPAGKPEGKPEDKAAGALPAAKPAKPAKGAEAAAPSKAADRPGAMPSAATGATAAGAPGALPESERTKQEPLPPLDLLAQLTNTPPPPETPLRTVVRRFKIWTPLAALLVIIFVVAQAVRPLPAPKLAVGGSAAFTFKGGKLAMPWPDQGQAAAMVVGVGTIGTSGPQKPVPTASVAKVMTAYVLLRDHPLKKGQKGKTITVDPQGEADSNKGDESRVPLKKGQQFTQYQMMQMLMIPSGNNVARQLARWDAGSEAAFVKKMNAAAKKLGMTNTTYTDPSGLEKSTVSTAVDQLKLAQQVVKNDVFREVVRTENAQIDGLPEKIYNNNSLLTTMAGKVSGIKTGSSTPAGGTFMWSGYRTVGGKDQLLLGVTMDQHTNSPDPNAQLALVLQNTEKVITAARDALVSDTVVKKGQVVGYVDDGLGGETPVVATKDLSAVGWAGMKASFSMSDNGKTIPHTAKAGTEVGVLTVGNGESTQQVPVALQKDLVEPAFGAKLIRIT
ncbi:serine hydrolase [Streptomyces angustmyceticus]|uniref:serine hydrolase n=1 Tax=Streptomyces angustmyceticus TaxID=285578 RepID=UPI003D93DFE2